jgi:hypothetical protein
VIRAAFAVAIAITWAASATATPPVNHPKLAPAQFTTDQYGLTFHVPNRATYCPLPKDWVGSDHGTVVFLERPTRCGGAGYPSSGRGFDPGDASRFELFYAYWMGEDEPPDPPCHRVGRTLFMGKNRPICESREGGVITRTISARYFTDIEAKAYFSLVTRPQRLSTDMAAFRSAAASFRTCTAIWHDPQHKTKDFTTGHGPLCPRDGRWF